MDDSIRRGKEFPFEKSNHEILEPRDCKKCSDYIEDYRLIKLCTFCTYRTPVPEETALPNQTSSDANEQCKLCEKFYPQQELMLVKNCSEILSTT